MIALLTGILSGVTGAALTRAGALIAVVGVLATGVFNEANSDATQLSKVQQGQVYDEALHILGGNANVISKWTDDIRVAVIGSATATAHVHSTELVLNTFRDIAEQTRLQLVPVLHDLVDPVAYLRAVEQSPEFDLSVCGTTSEQQQACANFVVLFSDADTMHDLSRAIPLRPVYQRSFDNKADVRCFFSPYQSRAMHISQAFVFVRDDLSEAMIKTCLAEEIYQSFGLFGDFTNSDYFSFNNRVEPKSITDYDRALLRSLYDPAIRPGSPVFRVVKRFIDELGIDPFKE